MVDEKRRPKKWAAEPFRRFLNYLYESRRILLLTMQGVSQIARSLPLAEALALLEREEERLEVQTQEEKRYLDQVKETADFAKMEEERGFPRLHAHALVETWSALEVLAEDLIVAWLVNIPESLSNPEVAKIRLPLSEYDVPEKEERMRSVYRELERNLKSHERFGVKCIEVLLNAVGLPGHEIPEDVRRNIFEMQQVRNAVVHRGSIADRRLTEACPWLGLELGALIRVTHQDYERYFRSVHDYVLSLINRVRAHFGIPPFEDPTQSAT